MFRAVAFVVLLAVVCPGSFLSAAQEPKWFELSSDHFLLYTNTSEAKGRRLLTDFEARVAGFSEAFGETEPAQFPIEIFVYKDDKDFIQAVPIGSAPLERIDKNAYLAKGPDRIFIVAKDKSPEDIADHVGHAFGHVLFERRVLWRPFWLAEAAGEYFRKMGRSPDGKKISDADGYSVSDLLTIVPSATYQDNEPAGAFRLQSYRLLRILLDEKPDALRTYLKALRTEEGSTAKIEVDTGAIGERFSAYTETLLKMPALTPPVKAAEADPGTLAIQRGDVLLASGRTADAANWYNADSNPARAARAILNRFTRGPVEAIRSLDRAAREIPESGLVQFHFGAMETQNATDIQSQVKALERAVQLLPRFGPAYVELARVYTLSGSANKALPLIARAIALAPDSADYIYATRSQVHLALGEYDESFRTIKIADALPHDDRTESAQFGRKVVDQGKKIETVRREMEEKRLAEIRRDVAAKVETVEPKPVPKPPPPPVPVGQITYEIEARSRIEVMEAILPEYPETMRKDGAAGKIALRINIGVDGRVTAASVIESQLPALNPATTDAIKKWTFSPPARAVSGVRVIVNFLLQ